MKKLFLFVGIAAMALTSCSSDDSNPDSAVVLPKKEIAHFDDGSSITFNFTYNGTKLSSISDTAGDVLNYTYTGDLITNVKYYEGTSLEQEDIYTYNSSGQIVEFVMLSYGVDWGNREVYDYNPDGSISVSSYIGDLDSQTTLNDTGTITFLSNGEIATLSADGDTTVYTYDNKNNVMKNVTGYRKIAFVNSAVDGINHNMTSYLNDIDNSVTTFTYNAAGYPVTSSEDYNGEITTVEYIYQ